MKVGLGVGALAVGAAILGAEDEGESDYWAGENAHWRAEGSGEIPLCEGCGRNQATVKWNPSQTWVLCDECLEEAEDGGGKNMIPKDEEKIHQAEDLTSSEFLPFDQITSEIQQEWDETTAPIAADYEPSNEPTNANFSAEEEDYEILYEKVEEALHKHLESQMQKGKSIDTIVENADAYAIVEEVIPHYHKYYAPLSSDVEAMLSETDWEEVYSAETVGSPSPSGPSSTPEPAEATGSEPSNEQFSAECGGCGSVYEDEDVYTTCDLCGKDSCDNCGDSQGPCHQCGVMFCYACSGCGDCGYVCENCECDCVTKEAESKTMNWVIGLTVLGVGVAALGYSDKILALFDRFKK